LKNDHSFIDSDDDLSSSNDFPSDDECSLIAKDLRMAFVEQDKYETENRAKKNKFLKFIQGSKNSKKEEESNSNVVHKLIIEDHFTQLMNP